MPVEWKSGNGLGRMPKEWTICVYTIEGGCMTTPSMIPVCAIRGQLRKGVAAVHDERLTGHPTGVLGA